MDILKPPPYVYSLATSSMLPFYTRAELQFSFPLSFSFSDSLPPSFLDRRLQLHFCANHQFTLKADDQHFPTTLFNLLTCLPQTFSLPFFFHISSYFIHSKSSSGRPSLPWFPSSCSHLTKGIHHTSPYRQPLNLYIFGPFRELKYSIFSTSKWKPFSIGFF